MREAMKQGNQPKEVPPTAKHGGEEPGLRERLGAEPSIWTDRMLAALENGVKGGKWFSLKDNFAKMGLFSLERAHREACQSR